MKVDQLFVNGDIHTFDLGQPRASTVAVIAGRIVAVGDNYVAVQVANIANQGVRSVHHRREL